MLDLFQMFLRRNVLTIVFTSKTMYKCDELSRNVFFNVGQLGNSMLFESHILDLLIIENKNLIYVIVESR